MVRFALGHERPEEEQSYVYSFFNLGAIGVCGESYAPVALPKSKRTGTQCKKTSEEEHNLNSVQTLLNQCKIN